MVSIRITALFVGAVEQLHKTESKKCVDVKFRYLFSYGFQFSLFPVWKQFNGAPNKKCCLSTIFQFVSVFLGFLMVFPPYLFRPPFSTKIYRMTMNISEIRGFRTFWMLILCKICSLIKKILLHLTVHCHARSKLCHKLHRKKCMSVKFTIHKKKL